MDREGEGVAETIMQMIFASEEWINVIRRELLSMLVWPILAILILSFTAFQVELATIRALAVGFVVYIFAMTFVVYFGVRLKFQNWEGRVARFKANANGALLSI